MSNKISYMRGIRRDIVKLLYQQGYIYSKALPLLRDNPRITQRKLRQMEKEGVINIQKEKGMITLKNYITNRVQYESCMPEGYEEYYRNVASQEKKYLSDDKALSRAKKSSETYIFAYGSGIPVAFDEKPLLTQEGCMIKKEDVAYYTSKEIKQCVAYMEESNKLDAGRINGCMVSPGGIYPIYNIGYRTIEWRKLDEEKIKIHIKRTINDRSEIKGTVNSCILLHKRSNVIHQILHKRVQKNGDKQTICIDFMYEHMYILPLSRQGQMMMEIMSTEGWKKQLLDDFIPKEKQSENRNLTIACDGVEEKDGHVSYILLFAIPDINRLKLFLSRAQMDNDKSKYKVYCFTHQYDIVVRELEDYAEIFGLDIEEYYKQYMLRRKGEY